MLFLNKKYFINRNIKKDASKFKFSNVSLTAVRNKGVSDSGIPHKVKK